MGLVEALCSKMFSKLQNKRIQLDTKHKLYDNIAQLIFLINKALPDNRRSDVFFSHSQGNILLHSSVNSVDTETPQQNEFLEFVQLRAVTHREWEHLGGIGVEPFKPLFLLKYKNIDNKIM